MKKLCHGHPKYTVRVGTNKECNDIKRLKSHLEKSTQDKFFRQSFGCSTDEQVYINQDTQYLKKTEI